jgi:hypothetical protein
MTRDEVKARARVFYGVVNGGEAPDDPLDEFIISSYATFAEEINRELMERDETWRQLAQSIAFATLRNVTGIT